MLYFLNARGIEQGRELVSKTRKPSPGPGRPVGLMATRKACISQATPCAASRSEPLIARPRLPTAQMAYLAVFLAPFLSSLTR